MQATALLNEGLPATIPPVVVLSGDDGYLKSAVFHAVTAAVLGPEDDAGPDRFNGRDAEWKSVRDELATVSMWGDRRLVIVDDADEFVTRHRSQLEDYTAKPCSKSVLILDVKSWPKNTRLAKSVDKRGLPVDCAQLKSGELVRWIVQTADRRDGKKLSRDAAQLLVELTGENLGQIDQELSKVVAYVGDRPQITPEDVRLLVGGWKAETTWTMLDAVRSGDVGTALSCLDKLLVAGEAPQRIQGGINFNYRKVFRAVELARSGQPLNSALRDAGVFPRDIAATSNYLRKLGRPRAERIASWLLEADAGMKGASQLSERVLLERLLLHLAGRT